MTSANCAPSVLVGPYANHLPVAQSIRPSYVPCTSGRSPPGPPDRGLLVHGRSLATATLVTRCGGQPQAPRAARKPALSVLAYPRRYPLPPGPVLRPARSGVRSACDKPRPYRGDQGAPRAAGRAGAAAARTPDTFSQADSAGSIPVTRSPAKAQVTRRASLGWVLRCINPLRPFVAPACPWPSRQQDACGPVVRAGVHAMPVFVTARATLVSRSLRACRAR